MAGSRVILLALALVCSGAAPAPAAGAAATPPPYTVAGLPYWRSYDWRYSGYREGAARIPEAIGKVFNVRTLGAKGNGIADDSAALEAAVAAANAEPSGGIVYLPAGRYKLTRPLTITRTKVVLRGDGSSNTTIYIPVALSDSFKTAWVVSAGAEVTGMWSAGGGFITFKGTRQKSGTDRTLLATVRGNVAAGQRVVTVDSTEEFAVGQRVRLFINDATTLYTRRRLQQAGRGATNTGPAWASRPGVIRLNGATVVTQAAPAWVQRHPVYQSALKGLRRRGPEAGEWFTPQQAASIQRQMAQDRGVTGPALAAANNTIVAWLYGQNNVDSGPDEDVIDMDEIAFSAVVAAIGNRNITLDRILPFPVLGSRWQGRIHSEVPTIEDAGVERLTVEFKHTPAAQHFAERGYNAFSIERVMNFWMRQVRILNADSGVFTSFVDRSTITDVAVGTTKLRVNPRWPKALNGHHALSLGEGHANMLTRFAVKAPFIHDVSVASGTFLNVISNGGGVDLNLDHHRTAPWANLFTNLAVGSGTRVFYSGGAEDKGAHSGRDNLYWNLYRSSRQAIALPPCGFGPRLNFVGSFVGDKCTPNNWVVRGLPAGVNKNYYAAQLVAAAAYRKAHAGKKAG